MPAGRSNQSRAGFTLVEVLIVVVILGILASTVLPQFTAASSDAKEAALSADLATLRCQIQLYRFQHNGLWPANSATDATLFTNQLLSRSNVDGTVNATSGPYGPYLIGQLPPNPFNSLRTITVSTTTMTADGSTGWIYNSATGQILANSVGNAPSGRAYNSF